jgi:hypothetical protein
MCSCRSRGTSVAAGLRNAAAPFVNADRVAVRFEALG